MNDLISRKALIEECEKMRIVVRMTDDPFEVIREQGRIFRKAVDEAPTVDAVEVVHGRWEDMSDKIDKGKDLRCSICHRRASNFVGGSEDWWDMWEPYYCPNCGAKMDGERND